MNIVLTEPLRRSHVASMCGTAVVKAELRVGDIIVLTFVFDNVGDTDDVILGVEEVVGADIIIPS